MSSLSVTKTDLNTAGLDEIIMRFSKTLKPRLWTMINLRSGITIDRSAAHLLLAVAKNQKHSCYPHQLSNELGVEAPFISRKIQELAQNNLIERQIDENDRRSFRIALTEQGQEVARHIQDAMSKSLQDLLSDWSASDKRELKRLLIKLINDTERFEKNLKQTVI